MITGEMKNKVDSIWDTIWTGGITSPVTVLEQITYLMFMKLLDDNQLKAEANANLLGVPLKNKVFQDGTCVISENPRPAGGRKGAGSGDLQDPPGTGRPPGQVLILVFRQHRII